MIPSNYKPLVQLGAVLLMVPFVAAPVAPGNASGKYMIEVPGIGTFYAKSFEGGNAIQLPVTRGARADKYPDKSPGALRYEDATFALPVAGSRELWGWVNLFSAPAPLPPRAITLSVLDANYTTKSTRVFEDSVLSVLELPTCDSGAKDPGYMKMQIAVGHAKENTGTAGAKAAGSMSMGTKNWVSTNFRLTIDGLATNRISKIDPIVIKHSPKGPLEYSNLVITIADVDAESWKQWAAQSAQGKPVEKNGKLELLTQNLAEAILTIQFEGLGVVRIAPETFEANSNQIARDKAELYVEKITFSAPSG